MNTNYHSLFPSENELDFESFPKHWCTHNVWTMTDIQIPSKAMLSNSVYRIRCDVAGLISVVVWGLKVKWWMSSDVMCIEDRWYIASSALPSALVAPWSGDAAPSECECGFVPKLATLSSSKKKSDSKIWRTLKVWFISISEDCALRRFGWNSE